MPRLKLVAPRVKPGRPALSGGPVSTRAAAERDRLANRDRPNWYQTARWQKLRLQALTRDGWICQQTGVPLIGKYPAPNSAAVDHIKRHRWDPVLFWDLNNLQSVSKAWHDSEKQRREAAAR